MRFEPNINLGQLVAATMFLAAGAGLWMRMDNRVTVLETQAAASATLASERSVRMESTLQEIKTDLKQLTRDVSNQQRKDPDK